MRAYSLGPMILELASTVLSGHTQGDCSLGAYSLGAYIHVSLTGHVHEGFFCLQAVARSRKLLSTTASHWEPSRVCPAAPLYSNALYSNDV